MDIASGRDNWRQDRERESEGGKEGERDREVDDRGSGLSRPRRGSPARTAAAVQTHKVRTHRQRTLASSSSVCAPQRKAACGLFTAHAASRPTRVKGGRRTRLAAQDRPTPEGVGGKGLAPTHGASTQSTRQHATIPHRGRERETGQQRPGPWTATAPGGGGCCRSTAPARRQELCVWAVRRGRCRRRLQTDSHTGAGGRGTRGKGGSADIGDMRRAAAGAAARCTGRGIAPVAGP